MRFNKYRVAPKAERTRDGITYASKAEMEYAALLDEFDGLVYSKIERQIRVELGVPENVVVIDFRVTENNGEVLYIEVKGVETPKFRRDMRLWRAYGPGTLYVVARKGKKWVQTHKIVPGEPAPKRKRKNRQ